MQRTPSYKDTPNYLLQIDNELNASTIEEFKKHDGLEDADFKVHKKTSFYRNGRTTIYLQDYRKAEEFFNKHKTIGGHSLKMIRSNSLEPNETNTWVLILSGTTLDKSNAGMHEELKLIRETIEKSANHYIYIYIFIVITINFYLSMKNKAMVTGSQPWIRKPSGQKAIRIRKQLQSSQQKGHNGNQEEKEDTHTVSKNKSESPSHTKPGIH
ncbi:hypothetical protein CYY_008049 [Polysphondylium violaceum]|uniref:Uncharacterized protein n=1 Tax=Polysphondylium violaceum TaxID=133409 RepID=A0A8J4PQZ9_9MYCE|nr:hypothetical protein CYY_008049 [Polysphondylium violaceum]